MKVQYNISNSQRISMKRRHQTRGESKPEEASDGSRSNSAESNSLLSSADDGSNNSPSNGMNNKKLKGVDNSSSSAAAVAVANKSSNGAPPIKTTLFSAVISRSTQSTLQRRKNGSNNISDKSKKDPPLNHNNSNATEQNEVSTPTRNLISKNNNNKRKLLSPMQSPGGYEILKALDDANLYHAHQNNQNDEDTNNKDDVRPADEFHDAKVYFNGDISAYEYEDNSDSRDRESAKEDLSNIFLDTSIVEATKHAFDLDDDNNDMKNNNNLSNTGKCHPEPCAVGVMDWSIKRRVRLDCIPGKCLPTSSSLSSSLNSDEGSIRQLAIQYMSCGGRRKDISIDEEKSNKKNKSSNEKEEEELTAVAQAKWLSSTMYYQHPAIHPLPSSLLQSSSSTEKKKTKQKKDESSSEDLSSYILQPQSVHNRVRLPGYGCMGGLGISSSLLPDNNKNNKAATSIISKQQQQQQHSKASSISTVSSLLYQRRRDWQESFRSMFHTWKSRLKNLEKMMDAYKEECNTTTNIPTQDEVSRCSFYSILPHQVVLFRGGYVYVDDQQSQSSDDDAKQRHEGFNNCKKLVPMIVFSSTTPYLRSKLQSMGDHLRLFTKNENGEDGMNYDVFTENLLNTDDEKDDKTNIHHEDVESVHAELDAIKHADDEKGKVTVEVKKRKQRSASRYDPTTANNRSSLLPPLFVSGDDDCAAVYELFMNTYGLSLITLEETEVVSSSKPTSTSSSPLLLDVPLLLCRSLGPCMHTTLRTLSVSSRRDCAYMNQAYTNSQTAGATAIGQTQQQRQQSSTATAKATLELRGPVLPCALRDMTCAVVNLMLLDKYNNKRDGENGGHRYNLGLKKARKRRSNDEIMDNTINMSSSHQFAMFLQAHDGECSTSAIPKATGSSSSVHFNGSNIPLLLSSRQDDGHDDNDDCEADDDDTSTHWHECRQGECMNVLVWDVSRQSVVSSLVAVYKVEL